MECGNVYLRRKTCFPQQKVMKPFRISQISARQKPPQIEFLFLFTVRSQIVATYIEVYICPAGGLPRLFSITP